MGTQSTSPLHFARSGWPARSRELAEPAPTAATAAAQLGCEVGAIANSLVFSADGDPLLVLTSGAHRVDTAKVAAGLGVQKVGAPTLSSSTPRLVSASAGSRPSAAQSRSGHWWTPRSRATTWWAAAGHVHTVFPTSFDELVRITSGVPADVG